MPAPLVAPLEVQTPATAGAGEDFYATASKDTIRGRVDQEIVAQYRYPPAVPTITSITSTPRQLTDGTTVSDITITFPVDRELLYDIETRQFGSNPEMSADLKESPLIVYAQSTNEDFEIRIRAKHPVSGFASDWSPIYSHSTGKDTTAPGVPQNLVVSLSETDGTVILRWNDEGSADLREYIIYRDGSEYSRSRVNFTSDPNLAPGEAHCYTVSSIDQSGNESAQCGEQCISAVPFLGTISVTPQKTAITNPPSSYGTAYLQMADLPPGARKIKTTVTVRSNTISGGSDTVTVRFSVGGAGSRVSNEVSLVFTSVPQELTAILTSVLPLDLSGLTTIFYEWKNTNDSTYQLTAPAALQLI